MHLFYGVLLVLFLSGCATVGIKESVAPIEAVKALDTLKSKLPHRRNSPEA